MSEIFFFFDSSSFPELISTFLTGSYGVNVLKYYHFLPETLDLKLKLPNPHDLGSKNGTSIVLFDVKSALRSYDNSLISMTVAEFLK